MRHGACRFDHADLLDDIVDHWDANSHLDERRVFVERLQALARARQLRVSFISGDVHLAAVGRLYTRPKVGRVQGFNTVSGLNLGPGRFVSYFRAYQ